MRTCVSSSGRNKGFTLVELAVVIVIIGVLSAFGVPRFRQAVERSKAGEAFSYLKAFQSAQERYLSRNGRYSICRYELDISVPEPKYFAVGPITVDGVTGESYESMAEDGWKLSLIRKGPSAGYGAYAITFSQEGFLNSSNIPAEINPMSN